MAPVFSILDDTELWTSIILPLIVERTVEALAPLLATCKDSRDLALLYFARTHQLKNMKQADAVARVCCLHQNIFLTGGAGVGKTHVLRTIAAIVQSKLGEKNTLALTAPTGAAARIISASGVRGQTLHMLFNIREMRRDADSLPFVLGTRASSSNTEQNSDSEQDSEQDEEDNNGGEVLLPTSMLDYYTLKRLQALDLLIIDECSMASSSMISLVHHSLCEAHQSSRPFGGLTVVCCADFFQLPPISKRDAPCPWAFLSSAWRSLHTVELTEVVRQEKDKKFAQVLNRMRVGELDKDDVWWLRQNTRKATGDGRHPRLLITPRNAECETRNAECLQRLEAETLILEAERSCFIVYIDRKCRYLSSDDFMTRYKRKPQYSKKLRPVLRLKVGCRVRCTKNVYSGQKGERELLVANGQLGELLGVVFKPVERVQDNQTVIDIRQRLQIQWDAVGSIPSVVTNLARVKMSKKQRVAEEKKVVAVISQFPVQLAYAITLHNAQGCSLDYDIDVKHRHWDSGGAYVALSRTTHAGLMHLTGPIYQGDARVSETVKRFYGSAVKGYRNYAAGWQT